MLGSLRVLVPQQSDDDDEPSDWGRIVLPRALTVTAAAIAIAITVSAFLTPAPPPPALAETPSIVAAPDWDPTTYFVDCAATTEGDGSAEQPWNAVSSVSRHAPFGPGDQILLRRGTTCAGRIAPHGSGVNGAPIVLGAYGSGAAPRVDGGGTPDRTATVQLTDLHDWVVQDLTVTNSTSADDGASRSGILALNTGGSDLGRITIRRNTVKHVTGSADTADAYGAIAVVAQGAPRARSGSFRTVRIESNVVRNTAGTGVAVWADQKRSSPMEQVGVMKNRVRRVQGDAVLLETVERAVVARNMITGSGCAGCSSGSDAPASSGITARASSWLEIVQNEITGKQAADGTGGGVNVDAGTSHAVLEYNTVEDNDRGIRLCGAQDVDVRFNVLRRQGRTELAIGCERAVDGIRIFNNDLLPAQDRATAVVEGSGERGTDPILFANNIVIDPAGGSYSWPSPVSAATNTVFGATPPPSVLTNSGSSLDPQIVVLSRAARTTDPSDDLAQYALQKRSRSSRTGTPVQYYPGFDLFGSAVSPDEPSRGVSVNGTPRRPVAPARPVATNTGTGVTLTWTGVSPGCLYEVKRAGTASGPFVRVAPTLNSTTLEDDDLPAGTYYYRIKAMNPAGRSDSVTLRVPRPAG